MYISKHFRQTHFSAFPSPTKNLCFRTYSSEFLVFKGIESLFKFSRETWPKFGTSRSYLSFHFWFDQDILISGCIIKEKQVGFVAEAWLRPRYGRPSASSHKKSVIQKIVDLPWADRILCLSSVSRVATATYQSLSQLTRDRRKLNLEEVAFALHTLQPWVWFPNFFRTLW